MADCIRMLAVDAVQQANSGHPGAPMGMAEMATVLWRGQHCAKKAKPCSAGQCGKWRKLLSARSMKPALPAIN